MREYLTAEVTINRVRMLAGSFAGAFCILEGHDDVKFFGRFFDAAAVQLLMAWGKPSVERAVCVLETDAVHDIRLRVLGIVDSDFSALLQNCCQSRNLLVTDCHDVEMIMFMSSAFDRVGSELGRPDSTHQARRETILRPLRILGAFRLVSEENSLGLVFRTLDFDEFIDEKTLDVNRDGLFGAVKTRSQRHDLSNILLANLVDAVLAKNYPDAHLCCGHDMLEVLSIALRRCIGAIRDQRGGVEHLPMLLRLAYSSETFSQTTLYGQISEWQETHRPYRLLAEEAR